MQNWKALPLAALVSLASWIGISRTASAQLVPLQLSEVRPEIGVEKGNVFIGACIPHGVLKLGPDCVPPTGTHGYKTGAPILGYSHTHLSGTGGEGRYGNIRVMPVVGPLELGAKSLKDENEAIAPGYYAVTNKRAPGDVHVELTASRNVGVHLYRFQTWKGEKTVPVHLQFDVSSVIHRVPKRAKGSRCTSANVHVTSPNTLEGTASFAGGWGGDNPYTIYFAAYVVQPSEAQGTWTDTTATDNKTASGNKIGAWLRYTQPVDAELNVYVAVSFLNEGQARIFLDKEKNKSFEQVRLAAANAWQEKIGTLAVAGGLPEQRQMLASHLYHTLLMPTDMTGQDPNMGGGGSTPSFWEHYCLWDTHRSVMPLHSVLFPNTQQQMLQGMLEIYRSKGALIDGWTAGYFGGMQGGVHSITALADGAVKGLFPKSLIPVAWKAAERTVNNPSDKPQHYGREPKWFPKGWLAKGDCLGTTSRNLEYAYNDYCAGVLAKEAGNHEEATKLWQRSQRIFEHWQPQLRLFYGKESDGSWSQPLDRFITQKDSWNNPMFYEGKPTDYYLYVPHAYPSLIKRYGGPQSFISFVDSIFDGGHFHLENEPSFLNPWVYHWAGRPDLSVKRVWHALLTQFKSGRYGLPGQDDSGALSSWYVWGSLGLFPVAGQNVYLIGVPLFSGVQFKPQGGKGLTITTKGTGPCVQKATLNGKPLNRAWLTHQELTSGGILELSLGTQASGWASTAENLPPGF